jgi:hypothetical protein
MASSYHIGDKSMAQIRFEMTADRPDSGVAMINLENMAQGKTGRGR